MAEKTTALLEGYRVLDLTDETGHLCGKILGDMGADVVKIEPPGGDPARNTGPFYHDIPHPEKSLSWFYGNLNKRGITLNLETADGRELFLNLVKSTDFIIESFSPGYMDGLGLGYETLEKVNPGVILTSITPFGQEGPYAHYTTTDIVGMAMGGMARVFGYMDSPPMRFSVPQFFYLGSIQGVLGTITALYHREIEGIGQHVDVSCQQAVVLTLMHNVEIWDMLKVNYRGIGPLLLSPRPTPPGPLFVRYMWPCKDGYVCLLFGGGSAKGLRVSTENLVAWANKEGYALELKDKEWIKMDTSTISQEEHTGVENIIGEFLKAKTKEELLNYAVNNEIMLIPVADAEDLMKSPQLKARNFWVEVDHPELGEKITYPGWPNKWDVLPPYQPHRRSPLIGEHNGEIYEGELGLAPGELAILKNQGTI